MRLRRLGLLLLIPAASFIASDWLGGYRASQGALAAPANTEMVAPQSGDRILIFAPHPDDEMLGCGGLIQQALACGAEVHVALMTNGDASELSLIFGERDLSRKPKAFIELGRSRQEESIVALGSLGLQADHVHFLGYPNNGLVALWRPDHWLQSSPYRSHYTGATASPYKSCVTPGAVYAGEQVLSDVVKLLDRVRPNVVYVTHPQDMHPDHWATCAFVSYGLATLAARDTDSWASRTRLYGYLIHWPGFPSPRRLRATLPLKPPSDIAVGRFSWVELPLTPKETKRKLRATRMYRSQLPSLDRLLLRFVRANELFALLPPRQIEGAGSLTWADEDSHRNNLRGAEIEGLMFEVDRDWRVKAELSCDPGGLGKGAYVSLDLRSWDDAGQPVIANISLARAADPKGVLVRQREVRAFPVAVRELGPGRVTVNGLDLPVLAGVQPARRGCLVTCWGSVQDKVTDPAVVARIACGSREEALGSTRPDASLPR